MHFLKVPMGICQSQVRYNFKRISTTRSHSQWFPYSQVSNGNTVYTYYKKKYHKLFCFIFRTSYENINISYGQPIK